MAAISTPEKKQGANISNSGIYPDKHTQYGEQIQLTYVDGDMYKVSGVLTNAQLKALNSTPIQITDAPGSGYAYIPAPGSRGRSACGTSSSTPRLGSAGRECP